MVSAPFFASRPQGRPALGARGMTLLEVMVSLVVITTVVLTTVTVMHTTMDNMKFENVVSDQQNRTRAAVDRIMGEMRKIIATVDDFDTSLGLKTNTLNPSDPSPPANGLTFASPYFDTGTMSINLGSAATAITYRWVSNPREIQGNGSDDDGNGLTDLDDGRIERLEGGAANTVEVVLDHVPQSGFLAIKTGRRLQIRIARKDHTPLQTSDGTKISVAVTHNTYCLRNY